MPLVESVSVTNDELDIPYFCFVLFFLMLAIKQIQCVSPSKQVLYRSGKFPSLLRSISVDRHAFSFTKFFDQPLGVLS